jgi:hypothetical protein
MASTSGATARLVERLGPGDVDHLHELHRGQRGAQPGMDGVRQAIDQLERVGPAAPGVVNDGLGLGLAGQEESRDRRRHRGRDLADRQIVDRPRAARHLAHQAERVGAFGDREPGLVERGDATDLVPRATHGPVLSSAASGEDSFARWLGGSLTSIKPGTGQSDYQDATVRDLMG